MGEARRRKLMVEQGLPDPGPQNDPVLYELVVKRTKSGACVVQGPNNDGSPFAESLFVKLLLEAADLIAGKVTEKLYKEKSPIVVVPNVGGFKH